MCDIYFNKCKVRGCKVKVDLHLADFSTGRDEIAMFCGKHLKNAAQHKKGLLRTEFTWVERGNRWVADGTYNIAVVPLTENAERNWEGNHPNTSAKVEYVHYQRGSEGRGCL